MVCVLLAASLVHRLIDAKVAAKSDLNGANPIEMNFVNRRNASRVANHLIKMGLDVLNALPL